MNQLMYCKSHVLWHLGWEFSSRLKLRLVLYTLTPHAINPAVHLSWYISHYMFLS